MARFLIISVVAFFVFETRVIAQYQETAPGTYIIFLKDKKNNQYTLDNPEAFLTPKSILRRTKQGIAVDSSDLPVSRFYIDSLQRMGLQVQNISRWYNSITFKSTDGDLLSKLSEVSFIQTLQKSRLLKVQTQEDASQLHETVSIDSAYYGKAYPQVHLHKGDYLHNKGYKGENMLMAVIDAGFNNYENMTVFRKLISENRIKATRDFVTHDGEVSNDNSHGSQVFSIIGGELPGEMVGTAPAASFLLLRSEDATLDTNGGLREYLVEEDNWISAAEYADSLGVDVINTSLGYTTFNNPAQDHSYYDMNGVTTRISLAAETAFKKGMIVIVSAGNEGSSDWRFISAPADAVNVLAVGAVNNSHIRVPFSSVGPSADNRIKPDVMSLGYGTFIQTPANDIISGSGTSYAAPVIAGLTACLWQSASNRSNKEIIDVIRKCSDNYLTPDNFYGYGIPDFKKAYLLLNPAKELKGSLHAVPNPFSTELILQHEALNDNSVVIEMYNTTGKKVYTGIYPVEPNEIGEISIKEISFIPRGIVFIRVIAANKTLTTTALKL